MRYNTGKTHKRQAAEGMRYAQGNKLANTTTEGRVFVHLAGEPFMICNGEQYSIAEVERIETSNDIVLEVIVE